MIKQLSGFNRVLFLALLGVAIITVTYFIFVKLGVVDIWPQGDNVLKFDGNWFKGISEVGYTYVPNQQSDMAFFPLFPYLWKLTGLSAFSISVLNLVIFVFAFGYLLKDQQVSALYVLAISSLPCFVFFFLPYSEALFFLFGVVLISGYERGSLSLQALGILGCCLARSASMVFIPAIIITEVLAYKSSGISKKALLRNLVMNTGACIGSILIVVIIQGVQTDKWFYFVEVQKYWSRAWLIPSLPFTLRYPSKALGLDGAALILGIVAMGFCFRWGINYLKQWQAAPVEPVASAETVCRSVYFSALFIAGIAIIDTCFTYDVAGRTSMRSIGRHIMCSAFAICFLNWLNSKYKPNGNDLYYFAVLLLAGVYLTGVYEFTGHFVYYVLFCCSFFVVKFLPKSWPVYVLLFVANVFFVVVYFTGYLAGSWIG